VLYNPDTGARQQATSTENGTYTIENVPAGDTILQVEKDGYNSVFREFGLNADSTLERDLKLQLAPTDLDAVSQDQGSPVTGLTAGGQLIRVGGMVAQSNLVQKITPTYPVAAKQAHVQGKVTIEAVISKEGKPEELRVVSSPSDDLSESALEAVRQWRYRPTLLNGTPVSIVTTIFVNYTLSQ
jgi:TonB family protein